MADEPKSAVLNIRVSEELRERLEKLASKYPLKLHAIARIALARGLDAIERDPKWFEKAGK